MESKKASGVTKSEGAVHFYTQTVSADGEPAQVFYNPVQVFNRDLTLLVVKTWAEARAKP